jgi:hypothetical protein
MVSSRMDVFPFVGEMHDSDQCIQFSIEITANFYVKNQFPLNLKKVLWSEFLLISLLYAFGTTS